MDANLAITYTDIKDEMMNQLELRQIKETCIYIHDLQRAKSFYTKILNLSIHAESSYFVFFKIGSTMLLLFDPKKSKSQTNLPPHHSDGDQHFAFEVAKNQYENWKVHLKEHGILIEDELTWTNGRKSFYFRDPENNLLEILEPGVWE